MQKQVKSGKGIQAKTEKFRKAVPVSKKSKGISREFNKQLTKNINKHIEKEMSARAGKFHEPLVHHKPDPQAVARAGWKKPGSKRGDLA